VREGAGSPDITAETHVLKQVGVVVAGVPGVNWDETQFPMTTSCLSRGTVIEIPARLSLPQFFYGRRRCVRRWRVDLG
jgi:hypothetical protein